MFRRGADIIRWVGEDVARRLSPSRPQPGSGANSNIWRRGARWALSAVQRATAEVDLLHGGWRSPEPGLRAWDTNNRALYLAYTALPFHGAGYAMRTHGLVRGVAHLGYDIDVMTRLGYPELTDGFETAQPAAEEIVDGVRYLRLNADQKRLRWLSNAQYLQANISATIEAARLRRPALVHGASNFVTGLTAVAAARALGLPSIYEVRGLWEVTAMSRDPSYAHSLQFAQHQKLEAEACLRADRVIAITQAVKDEFIRRGVPGEKIAVVPNGVESDRFAPLPRDNSLAENLGLRPSDVVAGYIGSVLDYEGLDDLIRAAKLCLDGGAPLRVLIVGDGPALNGLRTLARELDLGEEVLFAGRVPHAEVDRYYSLIDIAPFPRKPLPVCELVSPLKPFEAMAMAKCVIVSDVAALAEILGHRPIGLMCKKGDASSLAAAMSLAARDPDLRHRLGAAARAHVAAAHDWRVLARRVGALYAELGVNAAPKAT